MIALTAMKRGRKHKPTRSFKEFCAEFNISAPKLRGMLTASDAPKPKIQTHGNAYYDPDEFRVWFKSRTA